VLPLLIARAALALRPPEEEDTPPLPLSSPPRSVVVFDALALLAHIASASRTLRAAVRERVPRLATEGATARAKRDALRAIRAALAAPEHGVVGIVAPLPVLGGGEGASRAAALDSVLEAVSERVLRATLSALEAADVPPPVTIVSGNFLDEAFQAALDALGVAVCSAEDMSRALHMVMLQRHAPYAASGDDNDDDGGGDVAGLGHRSC
jgi:hypothetical protein